ncbi:coiled-coil domain-containing protein 171 isoform X3 [Ascaphus truei]|uniref:coiled-coil domain-containing protein 171 isoform X3 n=1 Tax=Ascaphus truei TaxID=8439 RepID=UPI003F59C28D
MTSVSQNHLTANESKRSQGCTLGTHRKLKQDKQVDFSEVSELRWKLNKAENENVDLGAKHNKEMTTYESQIAKLRSEVEKGEAVRQSLEYELLVARKGCRMERKAKEEEKANSIRMQEQFKVQIEELQVQMSSIEGIFQTAQYSWQEARKTFERDLQTQDHIIQNCNKEYEILLSDKNKIEMVLKEQNNTLQELHKKLHEMETEHNSHMESLRHQKSELEYTREREERLKLEFEAATQKAKRLEENIEAERAAHLESKFNSEIIQLRIRDLEGSLQVEKASQSQTSSDLDMIKKQFKEVENAYNREKSKAEDTSAKLKKLDQEFSSLVKQLKAEIEEKNRVITDFSSKLLIAEASYTTVKQELAATKNRQSYIEEAYGGNMRELQSLVDSFNVSSQRTSGIYKDKVKPAGSAVVLETLRHTLTDYQSRLEDTSNELEKAKSACARMSEEFESSKQMIRSLCTNLENTRAELGNAKMELNHLFTKSADRESLINTFKMDLEKAQRGWEKEKLRVSESENEILKLTRAYQKDMEEKLTFLHGLYQRLVAGCVLIKQPESMLGKFSWPELCVVLQENVDVLISDLNRANEKVSHLEYVCKNKADVMRELQQNHEDSLNKLTDQMKVQESCWQKQRRDLEQHYCVLLGEVQARAQKFQTMTEKSKDKIAMFEKTKDQAALENAHIKNLLVNTGRDHKSLLAACALMAGALYPLYSRSCSLAAQRDFLQDQVKTYEAVQNEIRTLVQALSETEEKKHGEAKIKKKHFRGMIRVFRKGVITVLAANRLQRFGRSCNSLFTWMEGFKKGTAILVCTGGGQRKHSMLRQQDEQMRFHEAWKWFTSSDLLTAVVSSVSELSEVLNKTDQNSRSQGHLIISSARNSFSKLMTKLSVEMENITVGSDRYGIYMDSDSLIQRLARGLHRLNSQAAKVGLTNTVPMMKCIAALKKQIFEFTRRLHTAEVERRSMRLELSDLKQRFNELRRNSDNTERLKEQIQQLKHSKMVPYEKFESACEELNNALLREQQAQLLLNEQSQQLLELNFRIEVHSTEEAEKDQTLSEAVKSISEAKIELRRKDQSLRQLNRQLSQLEQDRRRLEESIHNAESALRMAAKDKEILTNHMKSVEVVLHKVRDQISLSWTAATRNDFTLQLPKLHPEKISMEGLLGGPEFTICQNMIRSFMDVYQLACSKATTLEREISSHQMHIAALKSELQTACLREKESLPSATYDLFNFPMTLRTEFLSEKNTPPDFLPLHGDLDTSPSHVKYIYGNSRSLPHASACTT